MGKIREMHGRDGAKRFVNHLVLSYVPTYKAQKVYRFDDDKRTHACSVCGKKVYSVQEAAAAYGNKTINRLKLALEDAEGLEKPKKELRKYPLAYSGESTDTYLCEMCLSELIELAADVVVKDEEMSRAILKNKRAIETRFDENPELTKHKNEYRSYIKKQKKAKTTFGDVKVLRDLKKRMDDGVE